MSTWFCLCTLALSLSLSLVSFLRKVWPMLTTLRNIYYSPEYHHQLDQREHPWTGGDVCTYADVYTSRRRHGGSHSNQWSKCGPSGEYVWCHCASEWWPVRCHGVHAHTSGRTSGIHPSCRGSATDWNPRVCRKPDHLHYTSPGHCGDGVRWLRDRGWDGGGQWCYTRLQGHIWQLDLPAGRRRQNGHFGASWWWHPWSAQMVCDDPVWRFRK